MVCTHGTFSTIAKDFVLFFSATAVHLPHWFNTDTYWETKQIMRVATGIPGQAELEYYGANISDKAQRPQK